MNGLILQMPRPEHKPTTPTQRDLQLSELAQGCKRAVLLTAHHFHYGGDGMGRPRIGPTEHETLTQLAEEVVMAVRADKRIQALEHAYQDVSAMIHEALARTCAHLHALPDPHAHTKEAAIRQFAADLHYLRLHEQAVDSYRRSLRGERR